jgi:hypothetical protein
MSRRTVLFCVLFGLVFLVACQNPGSSVPAPAEPTPVLVASLSTETPTPLSVPIATPIPSATETGTAVPQDPPATTTATPAKAIIVQPVVTPESEAPQTSSSNLAANASPRTLFSTFMSPIRHAAEKKRAAHKAQDPEKYSRQVDSNLAQLGTTMLLVVCGLDHEPPAVERVMVCSNSLFLIRHDGRIDTITFTHDARFPEQEQEEGVLGKQRSARRSDAIWLARKSNARGLQVLRDGYQNATGLPVDLILVIQSDVAIKEFVDQTIGKIQVNVPMGFTAHPIYLDEKTKLPEKVYEAGVQEMDGVAVLQYMKAVPVAESYPPELENNERKHTVFRAIFDTINRNKFQPFFWPPFVFNVHGFVQRQLRSENVLADFDAGKLIIDNLGSVGAETKDLILDGQGLNPGMPNFGQARYYVDSNIGVYRKSPIQWGTASSGDPFAKRDIQELKIYEDYYVEVPSNANALDPDLVNGYWKPVRDDVRDFLLKE